MLLRRFHVSRLGALLLLAACGATPPGDWSGGIPRGKPAVVTLEHALTDPPRLIGMVNETHPGLTKEASGLRRSGMKSVPDASMDALLARLEELDFLDWSTSVEKVTPLDPAIALRRITVIVDGTMRALVVPRRPDPKLAKAFNLMSTSVQELFNYVVDLRFDPRVKETNFYIEQQQLLDRERQYGKEQGQDAAKPKRGPP